MSEEMDLESDDDIGIEFVVKQEDIAEEPKKEESVVVAEVDDLELKEDEEEDLGGPSTVIYPLANYTFGKGGQAGSKVSHNFREKMIRRKQMYEKEGVRNTLAALLLAHHYNHPHILMLRKKSPDTGEDVYSLPQRRLRPGEDVVTGLKTCLNEKLSVIQQKTPVDWKVCAFLGKMIRPNFDHPIFPYTLPHCSHPKEHISVYLMNMPAITSFSVDPSVDLVAVPLMEVYKNHQQYGDIVSQVPAWLSRVNLICDE